MSMACCRPSVCSLYSSFIYLFLMLYSEKYVTRAEYDELKNRFDQLEAFVHHRLGGTIPPAIPPMCSQSAIPSGLPGTVSDPGPSLFSQLFSQPPPPSTIYHQQQQHIMPLPPLLPQTISIGKTSTISILVGSSSSS